MDWARIMAPLSGGEGDRRVLAAAATVAEPFGAELLGVYAPADIADLIPWMGDGFMGGVQATAVESLRQAAAEGEAQARALFEDHAWRRKAFVVLKSPVWAALAMQGRMSDVIVFDDSSARGRGPLAEAFQQIVADEQRPTIVARPGLKLGGVAAVAWDGGKEASRAMRTALPLLQRASRVVIFSAPAASPRKFDPALVRDFLAQRAVQSEVVTLESTSDPAPAILRAAGEAAADILVAGAYGHARLQEFIFGGATRAFLNADGPSLFLSH